jgi:hypothetical protein
VDVEVASGDVDACHPRAVTPGEPLDLGPGDYVAGDFPYVCGALEPSTTVLMAVEHV